MIIPNLTLTNANYLIWKAWASDAAYPDGYEVKLSTTNGTTIADFTTNLLTVAAEGSGGWNTRSIDLSSYAGQTVSIAFRNNSNDKFLLYIDDISVTPITAIDMAATTLNVTPYNNQGAQIPVSGVATNNGIPVSSMTINYSVNNGTPVSQNLTGLNILPFGTYNFSFSQNITASTNGAYTLKYWASNINGSSDSNNGNDTLTANYFVAEGVLRNSLSELFSSSTCPPCASWNQNVYTPAFDANNFNESGSRKLVVKFQVPIPTPGDPSHNSDSDARGAFYGINSAPTLVLDGSEPDYQGATWGDVATEYDDMVNESVASPAFGIITGTGTATITGTSLALTVNGSVTNKADFLANKNLKLYLVVANKQYTFAGATNGDTEYHHVARKILPSATGISVNNLAVNASQTFNETFTFTIGGVTENSNKLWDANIEVIAILQDPATKYVVQSQLITVPTGVAELTEEVRNISIFPNPTTENATIAIDFKKKTQGNLTIYNSIGQSVFSESFSNEGSGQKLLTVPSSNFPKGVYFVELNIEGKRSTQKLVVE
jgi:hypothetical protein